MVSNVVGQVWGRSASEHLLASDHGHLDLFECIQILERVDDKIRFFTSLQRTQ